MPNFSCGRVEVSINSWLWAFDGGGVSRPEYTGLKPIHSEKGVDHYGPQHSLSSLHWYLRQNSASHEDLPYLLFDILYLSTQGEIAEGFHLLFA